MSWAINVKRNREVFIQSHAFVRSIFSYRQNVRFVNSISKKQANTDRKYVDKNLFQSGKA